MHYTPAIYAKALLGAHQSRKLGKPGVRRFMAILGKNHHQAWLPEILKHFENALYKKEGIRRVGVVAARKEIKNVVPAIRKKFGRKTEVSFTIQPDIIGGIILNIDNETIIDASVKTQLNRMFTK